MTETFLNKLQQHSDTLDVALIRRAYEFALQSHGDQKRMSGEPYIVHPCAVADILLDMAMDTDTIAAALLHDVVEDTAVTQQELQQRFGENIARLVQGLTKISHVEYQSTEERQAENIRRMLLAMADDIRVILIKLADRLHNMRTLQYQQPHRQTAIARETMDVYAPLAHRLGIFTIKSELEDLSFRYLQPTDYRLISDYLSLHHAERQKDIDALVAQLKERLEEMNIQASVGGRPKHVYSIYGKMSQQDKTFDQIYDLLAVRVIVHTVRDCYAVLGMVHTHWKPIPGRFKDYIAVPKENLYQSLHTTLVGQKGVPFEVQIRTWDMHRTAEYGIAAHWQYKENQAGRAQSEQDETKFKWLRSILEWQSDTRDAKEFMDTLKMDLFNDEIFVFTPKSAVISLPRGATPIDFAYYIHSAVGNRCVGAKINGRMQPLDTQLQTGDIVEIITSNSTRGPSRDWLKMVKSPQARSKIRAWFRKEFKEENIERGRTMMEEAAKKHAIALNDLLKNEFLRKIYRRYTLSSLDDLYAAVGCGGMPASQVVARLVEEHKLALREAQRRALEELLKTQGAAPGAPAAAAPAAGEGMEVSVRGQRGMLVRYSLCCTPRPGDDIVGFITRGRGVSVHRRDCPNIGNMLQDASRIVPVEWVRSNQKTEHRAAFRLTAPDGDGLFVRISNAISSHRLRLVEVNAKVGPHDMAEMTFTVEWKEEQQLRDLEQTLQNLPEIHQVQQIG